MMEIWRDIPGYIGLYKASSLGRIKSFHKEKGGTVLKPIKTHHGYMHNTLCKNKSKKIYKTHRLVMLAFVGKSNLQCNHINGNKEDNRLINLEYVTASENQLHASKIGLKPVGEMHHASKLTRKDVAKIRLDKRPSRLVATDFGIYKSTVVKIRAGLIWRNV